MFQRFEGHSTSRVCVPHIEPIMFRLEMFTYSGLCLTKTDRELRFHSDRSWKSTPDQWVLSVVSDEFVDTLVNCSWVESRLSYCLTVLIEEICSSGRCSGKWANSYLTCADQLTIVVDGVVVLPPVPKPIWVAMADSSWSRCLRRLELLVASCFCRSSSLCHSVELSTICWLSWMRVCCLFWRSLYCWVFVQINRAKPSASTARIYGIDFFKRFLRMKLFSISFFVSDKIPMTMSQATMH